MITLSQPPEPAAAVAPEPAVISRSQATDLIQSRDLPFVLMKANLREDAVLRQSLFIASVVTVVRPPEAADAGQDRYRWDIKTYQQRQLCLSSITGLFMCAEPEVQALPDVAQGEAPADVDGAHPLANAARATLSASIKARAMTLFDTARATHVQPFLRAAGVTTAAR